MIGIYIYLYIYIGIYIYTYIQFFPVHVDRLRLWRGCDKSVTTTAKSFVKAVATACGGGLTASVCRLEVLVSCRPVWEGT